MMVSLILLLGSIRILFFFNEKKKGPFLCKRFTCLKAVKVSDPLQGDRSLLTTNSPGVYDTHLIYLKTMKGWVDWGVA